MKIVLYVFGLLFLLASCTKDKDLQEKTQNYIIPGGRLPAFTLKDHLGNSFSSKDLRGKNILLIFFVSTCLDCQRELPKIETVWKTLKTKSDFRLIAISREETAAQVKQYWQDHSFTMPFYLDPERKVFSLFANRTIPRVYIINSSGVVTWMSIEKLELTPQQIIEKIYPSL